jgi:hypothetical protein
MTRVDLTGAIDMHAHFGPFPDGRIAPGAVQVAQEAKDAGHAGVVLKHKNYPSAPVAALADEMVDGIRVFGGVSCDQEVGGVNPGAVECALRVGAKVIWMPTNSTVIVDRGSAPDALTEGGDVRVIDDDGALLPATREILDLVAEHDAIVATGHSSRAEHFAVVREFAPRGRVLVTHAREAHCQPDLSIEDCVALADLGAVLEFCAITVIGVYACRPIGEIAATIEEVGPERCLVSSDMGGQHDNPRPAAAMQLFADALVDEGLSGSDVRAMACDRPAELLALA